MTLLQNKANSNFKQIVLPKRVYKFGGSSLATAEGYRKVSTIIQQQLQPNDAVVVSASGSTTDHLLKLINKDDYKIDEKLEILQQIRYHHTSLIDVLIHNQSAKKLSERLLRDYQWIKNLITHNISDSQEKEIIAYGELWSAQILCHYLESLNCCTSWIDARQFLKVRMDKKQIGIDSIASKKYLNELIKARQNRINIITGFIASDAEGQTVLLGRNGSDYSASLVANLTGASEIKFWTDVNGIYDFDPNLSKQTTTIDEICLPALETLTKLGSPTLHPKTLSPLKSELKNNKVIQNTSFPGRANILENAHSEKASNSKIKLSIGSTFHPSEAGTTINLHQAKQNYSIITHKNNLLAVNLSFSDEISAKKVIRRLTMTLESSFEFNLIIKVDHQQYTIFLNQSSDYLKAQLQAEIKRYESNIFTLKTSQYKCSLIAIVNNSEDYNFYHIQFLQDFLASKQHSANQKKSYTDVQQLGNACFSIIDRSVIDTLAKSCFESWKRFTQEAAIFLIGSGNVGKTWVAQWERSSLNTRSNLVLSANSKKVDLLRNGKAFQQQKNTTIFINRLLKHSPFKNKVVIDATSSEEIANNYTNFINTGTHIISANKITSSADTKCFSQVTNAAEKNNVLWLTNATVGAGLPVNNCIQDLIQCGDEITEIRGVFSGTLSWILQCYDGNKSFSELVKDAQEKGYSEPDPRVDLSGQDVARKLLILARHANIEVDFHDIDLTPVIKQAVQSSSLEEFWQAASQFDRDFDNKWQQANNQNKRLVYQAKWSKSGAFSCELIAVKKCDPLAQLTPCDNVFVIHSLLYKNNPLVIQGPGAGREVTAAAIQSDLIKVLSVV
ncbi:MAG: hypothetical protein HWE27_07295 [Gammaproteobacteria bacterium]|nr:hypothetical protein [Gammaproteobacteria bacterium]